MPVPPSYAETSSECDDDDQSRAPALRIEFQSRDFEEFDDLLRRYWAPVVGYVDRMLGSEDAAEDVAQEAFIQLWRHRAAWVDQGSVQGYLYRTARNLALNEARRLEVRVRSSQRLRASAASERRPTTPSEELDGRMLERAVEGALAALPERRREVFVLIRFHGLSYRQVAEVMGVSAQTVANQMTAALAELRRSLEPFLAETTRQSPHLLAGRDGD